MSTPPDEPLEDLHRACPVCACSRGRLLHTQDLVVPDEFDIERTFDVVECSACGMVFADVTTRQEALDDLYRDHSKYADPSMRATTAPPPETPWDLDRLRATATYLDTAVPGSEVRILDAGCATGALLGFLRERGRRSVCGLDPSPVATATARERYGADAVTGSFLDPPPGLGPFDLVTLCHVLEHLADLDGAVAALRTLLAPRGLVYVEVPDASRFAEFLVAPFNDFNTEHINHFSLPLVDRLLRSHGFEPVDKHRRTVGCSPTDRYPVALGIWQERGDLDAPVESEPDPDLAATIRDYVARSADLLAEIDASLRARLPAAGPIMVWGAGQLSMKLLRDTVLAERDVAAIIDSAPQKQGLHFDGTPVVRPDDAATMPYPVVVGSVHRASEIVATATQVLGVDRELILLRETEAATRRSR